MQINSPPPGEPSMAPSKRAKTMDNTTDAIRVAERFFLSSSVGPVKPDNVLQAIEQARRQEREHLARELHDVLGSELTAARLQLACLKSHLGGHSGEVDERLGELDKTLRAALALKRRIIDGLEPASLRTLGLTASLRTMLHGFEGAGVRLRAELDDVDADRAMQLIVYRVVQESLTNCIKHAGAREIRIVLRDCGQRLAVSVQDDGCGFDALGHHSEGHGLHGLRQRVEATGGHLDVEAAPYEGTCVRADLPKFEPFDTAH